MFKKTPAQKKHSTKSDNLIEPYSIPFVGRETELHTLQQALAKVITEKKPKFVFIEGDFGVGKTALVDHFLERVAQEQPEVLIGRGVCATETELSGLAPFVALLGSFEQQLRFSSDKWMEFVKNVAPAWIDVFTFNIPSNIIKTFQEGKKLAGKTSYKQESIFIQFTNMLLDLAKKQPMIAFLDALQWADASSLELLTHLTRYLPERAILFVFTYRTEAKDADSTTPMFNELRARTLRYEFGSLVEVCHGIDVAAYFARRYPYHTFPEEFIEQVVEKTQGHPLFLTLLCDLWQATSVITTTTMSEGELIWKIAQRGKLDVEIPSNIQVVLEQRLRLLHDELRKMLTFAAVEGEEFTVQVLAALSQCPEYDLYDHLEALEQRHHFIQEQETKKLGAVVLDIYRFTQRFYRDYIYEQLSAGKKRFLHHAIGEHLETLYSQNLYQIAGQLTAHFRIAHQPQKAAQYAFMAAQFEQSRNAWTDAEDLCDLGLTLLDTIPPDTETHQLRLDLLDLSGDGYYKVGKYPQADQRYRTALNLAQEIQAKPEQIAEFYAELADTCEGEGRIEEMIDFIEKGQEILAANAATIPIDVLHIKLGWLYAVAQNILDRYDVVLEYIPPLLEDAAKLPQNHILEFVVARIYNILAIAFGYLNRFEEARVNYERSIALLEKIGEIGLAAGYSANLAGDCNVLGKFEEGLALISKAIKITSQIGDIDDLHYAKAVKGALLLSLEKFPEALQELKEARILADQCGARWDITFIDADIARAYLALNDLNCSYQYAHKSLIESERRKSPFEVGNACDVLGQVETARQDWMLAAQHFQRAIALFEQVGNRYNASKAQYHFAEALCQQGKIEEAEMLLQKALETFQDLKIEHEVVKVQEILTKSERNNANGKSVVS